MVHLRMRTLALSFLALFVSISCVAQWSPMNSGFGSLATGTRLLGASDTHLFAVSIASGVYRADLQGNTWTPVTTPVGISSAPKCGYYYGGRFFVGLDNSTNCIYYTPDNGVTWTGAVGSPASTVVRGFVGLPTALFAYTSSSGVYRSSDGGVSWSASNTGLTNLKIVSMTVIDSRIVAATDGGGVFVSTDGGSNWSQSNKGITAALRGTIVWTMGSTLYYYTKTGNQYFSSVDQGGTWTVAARPSFLQSSVIGLTKSLKEVYRSGTNVYMMSTTQYGISITDSVYASSNDGATWEDITGNLPVSVLGSGISETHGYIYMAYGTPDHGIWRRATTALGVHDDGGSDAIELYPNPFTDNIVVAGSSRASIQRITVYDILGRTVISEEGNVDRLHTEGIGNGPYVVHVTMADQSTIVKTLIKERANR